VWKLNQKVPLHQLKLHGLADLMVIRAGHLKNLANAHVSIDTKKTKTKTKMKMKNQPLTRSYQDIVDAASIKAQATVHGFSLRDSWHSKALCSVVS
jgi:hypothetical protein